MELVAGLTWDKQLKRLKERFGSGDLDGIVDVLATLVDADARRPLNHSQRMLRDKAEEAFITEIGAALELSPEDAQDKVGDILARASTGSEHADRREPLRRSDARSRSCRGPAPSGGG